MQAKLYSHLATSHPVFIVDNASAEIMNTPRAKECNESMVLMSTASTFANVIMVMC